MMNVTVWHLYKVRSAQTTHEFSIVHVSQIINLYDDMVVKDGGPYKNILLDLLGFIKFKVRGCTLGTSKLAYKFCHGNRLRSVIHAISNCKLQRLSIQFSN
jgi:hypothetical protein